MKILAIERESTGAVRTNTEDVLQQEARHVFELYLSDTLREIYFTEHNNAVLVLEASDTTAAQTMLAGLPLVKAGMITFDIMELRPYPGYRRILQAQHQ